VSFRALSARGAAIRPAVDTGFRRYGKKERRVGELPDRDTGKCREFASTLISPHWCGTFSRTIRIGRKGGREQEIQLQIFAASDRARATGDGPQTPQFSHPRVADATDSRNFAADSLQMQQTPKRAATVGCRRGKQIKAMRRFGSDRCRPRGPLLTSLLHVLA
jgi:hypothetical protein